MPDRPVLSVKPTHDSWSTRAARFRSPGYGWCLRCGMPWNKVEKHLTPVGNGHGCFPLCEACWGFLTSPEARIEYYDMLVAEWERMGSLVDEERKTNIKRAVANGG